jgi:hypothetical protein
MLMVLSVIVIEFEEGRPLLSGRADENDHSSSSFAGAGGIAVAGGADFVKSNIEAETED